MVTIYSEKESLKTKSLGEIADLQLAVDRPQSSYEEINKEIQANLKAFEHIDWTDSRAKRTVR